MGHDISMIVNKNINMPCNAFKGDLRHFRYLMRNHTTIIPFFSLLRRNGYMVNVTVEN